MTNDSIKLEIGDRAVKWTFERREHIAAVEGVVSHLLVEARQRLYLLSSLSPELFEVSLTGGAPVSIDAPAHYKFSYLVPHPDFGPSVVCVGDHMDGPWSDFHFSISIDGKLEKRGPAY